MNQEQAIEIAKAVVEQEGWEWLEPVKATKYRLLMIIGPLRWKVWTNAGWRGMNAEIIIDDKTGKILRKGFIPR